MIFKLITKLINYPDTYNNSIYPWIKISSSITAFLSVLMIYNKREVRRMEMKYLTTFLLYCLYICY